MGSSGFILACAMALLFVIYSVSSAARYHLKFILFTVVALIGSSAPIPLMLLKPKDPKNALIPAWILRRMAWFLGISWEVRGVENIDNTRGTVVLMNHQSGLDLIVLAILWPIMDRCTVISKKSIFYLWPFGLGAWLWGTVFINRSRKGEAMSSINQQADAIKARKAKLLIFPEATRQSNPELLPFKKGGFHVSLQAESPIQPVVISKYHYLDHKQKRFNNGHFILTILPLIETTDYNKDNLDDLVCKTRKMMQITFTDTSDESLLINTKNKYKNLRTDKP